MEQKIKEIEILRKKSHVALAVCFLPLILAVSVGAILGLAFQEGLYFFFAFFGGLGAFIVLAAFYYAPIRDSFVHLFKTAVVKDCLTKVFDDVEFSPDICFDKETIKNAFLVPIGNTYKGDDKVTAIYKGIKFSQCDLNIQNIVSIGDSVTVEQYFWGKWIILDFKKKIDTYLQIRENETGAYKASIKTPQKPQKIMTESIEFNKSFSVLADDGHNAFYILTPQFMLALLKLKALVQGKIMIAFSQGKMHIALNNNKNAFEPPAKELKSSSYQEKVMAEILIITQIIDELIINLNN